MVAEDEVRCSVRESRGEPMDGYEQSPHVVTWEVTRACQLHCRHCRARAIPRRDERELSLSEMVEVFADLRSQFPHPPILVFTGGDPLERPDLDDMIIEARAQKLIVAIAPSVTPKLNHEVIHRWKELGVHAVSLSLDGVDADVHDAYRGVRGTFIRTIEMAEAVVKEGLSLQINTAISQHTLHHVRPMSQLVQSLGVSSWELFFVIPTGRARIIDTLKPNQIEEVLQWVAQWAPDQSFRVTAVGAPQWSRVLHQYQPARPPRTVAREARGFAFIDHQGKVYPSGYLPVVAGDLHEQKFSEIYRHSDLFQLLRDPNRLTGACGLCQYRTSCGGSRARAYAVTGNLMADDPGCAELAAAE